MILRSLVAGLPKWPLENELCVKALVGYISEWLECHIYIYIKAAVATTKTKSSPSSSSYYFRAPEADEKKRFVVVSFILGWVGIVVWVGSSFGASGEGRGDPALRGA